LTFGGLGTTERLTRGKLRPLSAATLGALVPAIHAPDQRRGHKGAVATRTPVVGVRAQDPPSSPNVIQRIDRVVPLGVWIALALALALAVSAGVATVVAGRRAHRQSAQLAAVSAQALTDPLTGVLNRRGFLDALERELARARRYERPVALAYVDVRGLKAVNDSEGHLAGDELLREAAGMLEDSARADDVVGRMGGDELALLLGEQSSEGATAVANRIRAQVPERREALQLREPWDLTIGTASFPADGTTVDELLAAADRRLYEQRGIELR
jgi:diguanylate cyclase (GGDEF)-like protein